MIIYLHGFGSSGSAFKARLLKRLLPDIKTLSPDLSVSPHTSVQLIHDVLHDQKNDQHILIIGSSLGGFYGLHFHITMGMNALLLNPTIDPLADLPKALKRQTLETFPASAHWRVEYLEELKTYYHPAEEIDKGRLRVYLTRDDEVLDYRKARRYFLASGCPVRILAGGSHVFLNFTTIIPEIEKYHRQLQSREQRR